MIKIYLSDKDKIFNVNVDNQESFIYMILLWPQQVLNKPLCYITFSFDNNSINAREQRTLIVETL